MNIQYTDLNGEYFFCCVSPLRLSVSVTHPLGREHILRAEVYETQVNNTFEVTILTSAYETHLNRLKYETLLIEDCVAYIRENVTRQMLVPSTEIFRNWILEYGVDLTPLVKYYPDLAKFI